MRKFCEPKHIKGKERRIRSMKKSIFSKVGAAAMVLTLVTASLVGGTFAKYTSTASGTATATAAAWNITFEGNSKTYSNGTSITLSKDDNGRAKNMIVPGDSNTLDLKILGNDSEVGFDYTIEIKSKAPEGTTYPIIWRKDGTELTGNTIKGHVNYAAGAMDKTETITWELPVDTGAENVAGNTFTYDVVITATQSTEVETASAS